MEAVNVRVGPSKLLIPDLLVTRRLGATAVYQPEDVLLVVELRLDSTVLLRR